MYDGGEVNDKLEQNAGDQRPDKSHNTFQRHPIGEVPPRHLVHQVERHVARQIYQRIRPINVAEDDNQDGLDEHLNGGKLNHGREEDGPEALAVGNESVELRLLCCDELE